MDRGDEAQWLKNWVRELKQRHKIALEVGERSGKGLAVVKQRWQVERTFCWISHDRRKARDYETLTAHGEAMSQIRTIPMRLKRMA